MFRFIAVIVVAVAAAAAVVSAHSAEFELFMKENNRVYSSPAEEAYRAKVFAENLVQVRKLQAQYPGEYGITSLADRTRQERRRMLISHEAMSRHQNVSKATPPPPGLDIHTVPKDKLGAMPTSYLSAYRTYTKSQGQCGSCWAFTVSALAEARYMRNRLVKYPASGNSITPQQLVSCWQKSCEGSYIDDAANWLVNRFTVQWNSWPYASTYGTVPACKTTGLTNAYKATWAQVLPQTNFNNITTTVYYREAVSIAIGVCPDFYDYMSSSTAVYSCRCSKAQYDGYHAMTIVGYNIASSTNQYLIVKNSWNTNWGRYPSGSITEKGYVFLKAGTCSMYDNVNTFVTMWP